MGGGRRRVGGAIEWPTASVGAGANLVRQVVAMSGGSTTPGLTDEAPCSVSAGRSGGVMRAWAAVGTFLVLVNTAAAEQPVDSGVPPLADGEIAPADAPNHFDTRELGVATIAAL